MFLPLCSVSTPCQCRSTYTLATLLTYRFRSLPVRYGEMPYPDYHSGYGRPHMYSGNNAYRTPGFGAASYGMYGGRGQHRESQGNHTLDFNIKYLQRLKLLTLVAGWFGLGNFFSRRTRYEPSSRSSSGYSSRPSSRSSYPLEQWRWSHTGTSGGSRASSASRHTLGSWYWVRFRMVEECL